MAVPKLRPSAAVPFIVLDGDPPHWNLKFGAAAKDVFLNALASYPCIRRAAKAAGVCFQTVYNHFRKDADFAAACEDARRCGVFVLRCVLMERALLGPPPAGEAPKPITFDEHGFAELDARYMDVDLSTKLIAYHDSGYTRFGRGRPKMEDGPGHGSGWRAGAVTGGAVKGGAGSALPASEPLPRYAETDAVLAQVIAKFDSAAKQKRHEARLRGREKRDANRALAQAKKVEKRRAAKRGS